MKYNNYNCSNCNIPVMPASTSDCNIPASTSSCNKRYLEPVLIAKVYNQPIIEEYPNYSTSMDLDYTTNVSNYQYKPFC